MKRRRSQWTLLTAITSLASLAAMILFERTSTRMAEFLFAPWFTICRAITPVEWQLRGNILLGMMFLISGIVVYSMLVSAAGVGFLALVARLRRPQPSQDTNDQEHAATQTRSTLGYVLLFLVVFNTLVLFVVFGGDSVPPKVIPAANGEPTVQKRHPALASKVRPEDPLPQLVYAGGVREEYRQLFHRDMILTDNDAAQISAILREKKHKFSYLEITRAAKMKVNQCLVHPEPEADVIHSGLGLPFEKVAGQWRYLPEYWDNLLGK